MLESEGCARLVVELGLIRRPDQQDQLVGIELVRRGVGAQSGSSALICSWCSRRWKVALPSMKAPIGIGPS